MAVWQKVQAFVAHVDPLNLWLASFLLAGLVAGVLSGYLKARKIQPNGFKWKFFRREMMWAVVTLSITGAVIGGASKWLQHAGIISFHREPASPWIMAGEFALYFIGFDTWFYWLHRLMHKEPFYTWIHKIHHGSLSPNVLTTFSESPLEGFVNGGYVILFTTLLTVHAQTMVFITPFNVLMGLYVHSGYEFFPRWWNRSWATKWFITATFHDQHHRFFKGNYGGYTTVWDRLCGTMRPTFEADFDKVTSRPIKPMPLRWPAKARAEG
jgi:sterol desaturase/sphingolipid hydroxylase (fatty acid hydroxylase superfamily)